MPLSTEHIDVTGLNLREVIQRVSDAACRENTGGTFVTWNTTNQAAVIARTLTETVLVAGVQSRYTPASFPAVAAGTYRVIIWDAAANAAIAQTPDFDWTGTAIVALSDITAKTGLITADGFTVSSPVDPATGILSLIAGDGYETAERIIEWTKADYSGPAIQGTGKLRITTIDAYQSGAITTAVVEADATVAMDGSDLVVSVPLTEAQTTLLQPGPARSGELTHWYQILIDTEEGAIEDDATNFMGGVIVRRRITPTA